MAHSTLERVLAQLEDLEPEELRQVIRGVRGRLGPGESPERQAFEKALLAAGLVREASAAPHSFSSPRTPIQVEGDPVSQTSVRERR